MLDSRRFLSLTFGIAFMLAFACVATAQTSDADAASALLQQGIKEYQAYNFSQSKAVLLKVDQMTAWRWLCGLVYAGLLQVVEKGRQAKSARRATRFRYLGKL